MRCQLSLKIVWLIELSKGWLSFVDVYGAGVYRFIRDFSSWLEDLFEREDAIA